MTTSATGGYLSVPVLPDNTDAIFHGLLAGISGLPGNLVMPAFQDPKPIYPANSVNWLSYWIESVNPDNAPVLGVHELSRNAGVSLTVYAYGPQSREMLTAIVDGLAIKQNSEAIMAKGFIFQGVDAHLSQLNEQFNNQWHRRFSTSLLFGQHIERDYKILDMLDGDIEIYTGEDPRYAAVWLEIDQFITADGQYTFPADAPWELQELGGSSVRFAYWLGQSFYREFKNGTDGGWQRIFTMPEIDGELTADGTVWIPADAPKTVSISSTTAAITSTWGGEVYSKTLTGLNTSTITDTGWIKQ